ncbi:S8 family peptidase [Nocardia neocaledoniensis]|uniref:S8 family peptidase n=1 Tax=Nocardia neocaledoniensis TaxID=236511 RepID=UPI0024565205|nr:S8 family peptidase [Nocardia neocaledoniensis]
MASSARSSRQRRPGVPGPTAAPAELVVVTATTGPEITPIALRENRSVRSHIDDLLPVDAHLVPIFGPDNRLAARLARTPQAPVAGEYLSYYAVRGAVGDLGELAERLRQDDTVAAAYVKPAAELPLAPLAHPVAAPDAPAVTPDFRARQGYLDAAPTGIDAVWAHTRPGGLGTGVRVIDVEGAWRFTHEDLRQNQGGMIGGTASPDLGWRNHGTAVAGEISGDLNAVGVTGIAPEAHIRAVSVFGIGSATAIRSAADALDPGDVLLIELHRPGPRFDYRAQPDQRGYIAVEWWPDDFAAIRYAVGRGVVVVEAAGNGNENLDDPVYDARPGDFPTTWHNPFRGGDSDSGAVLVGAGAPPPGLHGRDHGPARSRLPFSNHGARLDVQGWGREVTTTGYGDLQGGPDEDLWYTDEFSGTSSASPIVVGAIAAYQGIRGARRAAPDQIRTLLRTTGSPQTAAPGRPVSERIGALPDLRAMLDANP